MTTTKLVLATVSGLKWTTIKRYAKSELLDRGGEQEPIYMHHASCPSFCDFACNGTKGERIATDVETLENRSDETKVQP